VEISSPAFVCLAILFLVLILVFVHDIAERFPRKEIWVRSPSAQEIHFALKEGQTIVGARDTTQGIFFYIGDSVGDEKYCDL
jgi:hypothetical protein